MSKLKNVLPLGVFIRRQQSLMLYRDLMRAARKVDDPTIRLEIMTSIRVEFKNNLNISDPMALKSLILVGNRSLKQIQSMSTTSNKNNSISHDNESWMNIKDDDDVRGRIGQQWPWQKD